MTVVVAIVMALSGLTFGEDTDNNVITQPQTQIIMGDDLAV